MAAKILRTGLTLTMVLVLAVTAAGAAGATQTDDAESEDEATTIDSCTTITEPGVYKLDDDLTNRTANETVTENDSVSACILVRADDVVVDGNDDAIEGTETIETESDESASVVNQTHDASLRGTDETLEVGVAVSPPENETELRNVTVRNVETSNWAAGLFVENVTKSSIENVEATENTELGVEVRALTFSKVTDVRVTDNGGIGVLVSETSYSAVDSVQSADNRHVGVLVADSKKNKLTNVSAVNHSVAGVAAVDSSGNGVTDVEVRETGGADRSETAGLLFDSASNNVVTDVNATANENWAYYATNGSADNLVLNLTDEGRSVSFVGTDVAIRFDEAATDDGSPLTIRETTDDGSILVLSR